MRVTRAGEFVVYEGKTRRLLCTTETIVSHTGVGVRDGYFFHPITKSDNHPVQYVSGSRKKRYRNVYIITMVNKQ